MQKMQESLGDAALLLLMMVLIPVAIIIAGAPLALFVRLIAEIAHKF
jgi:hypothetical protein